MQYFTDSYIERMMRMTPDQSGVSVKRNRREMMEEYEYYRERKAAENVSAQVDACTTVMVTQ